jgi:cysteine sulfinate desulfinase/cysteine desulfurase-like protein
MMPYLEKHYGNPSSPHAYGLETRNAIDNARAQVASALGCQPTEIVFTSGGTESNNMAIQGVAFQMQKPGNHIITSAIEHPAVTEVCRYLEKHGFEITLLPVDEFGLVNPSNLREVITEKTILVTVMHANNEVGTIQPISELAGICHERGILFHTDAAQTVGKISTSIPALGVDLMSVAGHKFYAPKGVGALFVREGVKLQKFMHGADHENNLRAGTENVAQIVGLGKACEIAAKDLSQNQQHMMEMRDLLHKGIEALGMDIRLNGHPENRLPNTLSLGFKDFPVSDLLYALSDLAVSAGAACHGGDIDSSTVLGAMKVPESYANGSIRFSVGKYTGREEIEKAVDIINTGIQKLSGD